MLIVIINGYVSSTRYVILIKNRLKKYAITKIQKLSNYEMDWDF